ncbi:MAG: glycoside hydrolase family 125 protein [Bacteroidaceae bacterium]|nr:glycoside hydrolase family 125 protein [Bacteroidaceae bacterium]
MKNNLSKVLGFALLLILAACNGGKKNVIDMPAQSLASDTPREEVTVSTFVSNRPAPEQRLFTSHAVEAKIQAIKHLLTNHKLVWMFENCFPNTLDTTVHFDGADDTFVYTGDIHAMWLRDSGAQVYPYVQLCASDPELQKLIRGVILRQLKCILIDPYANAFNMGATGSEWMSDRTAMKPELHERKWEIDSLCYPLRLAYAYWKATGDDSIFRTDDWTNAVALILATFRDQQRKEGHGSYNFQRRTERASDTQYNSGWGQPINPVGLIASSFRPSDDATTFPFLIPSNFFAVSVLDKTAEILSSVKYGNSKDLAKECRELSKEVSKALKKYAVYKHPKYGKIYAFEVDGFGNQYLMDDANVPSLLAMAYLGGVDFKDPVYRNTRRFVWSHDNPYFFSGTAGEGIGGPHVGFDMIWPMSIIMRAFTAENNAKGDEEVRWCLQTLLDTDAGTGFMHETFHVNDPQNFTRSWFAWANTLFGELIIKLVDEGKVDLLNSLQ